MTASRTHDTHDLQLLRNPAIWVCAMAAAFTVGTARAAGTSPDDLQSPSNVSSMTPKQAYEHDKAFCNSGQSSEPKARCLQEAARAYSESRRGRLDDGVMAQAGSSDNSAYGSTSTSGTSSDMNSSSNSDNARAARTDRN